MTPELRKLPFTDLSDPIMFTNPFPRYAELRRTARVSRTVHREVRRVDAYMLTRYEDVVTLHTDARFTSTTKRPGVVRLLPQVFRMLFQSMAYKDGLDHKRLRGLVSQAFVPKMVKRMEADTQKIVDGFIDDLARRGTVDLVADLAVPLPLAVIANVLGIGDYDRDEFKAAIVQFMSLLSSGSMRQAVQSLAPGKRILRILERLVEQRRIEPDDRIISALVRAREDGDSLTDLEIVGMIFLLLVAGYDTISNLIGGSVLALLDHPEQLDRLRADPAVIDTAVEELLRFTTPLAYGVMRTTVEEVEIGDVTIPKASSVIGVITAANRDESVFDAPDVLDLGRSPNRHIAFGTGHHYCLGSQLTRMESKMALLSLVQRFGSLRLAVPRDQIQYKPISQVRGLRSLPLTVR